MWGLEKLTSAVSVALQRCVKATAAIYPTYLSQSQKKKFRETAIGDGGRYLRTGKILSNLRTLSVFGDVLPVILGEQGDPRRDLGSMCHEPLCGTPDDLPKSSNIYLNRSIKSFSS